MSLTNERNIPMKFDITRAWKDETYRQSLSAEQLRSLPANPAGELSDADLATIAGSGDEGFGNFGAECFANTRNESVALICEVNVFSINVSVINILGTVTQACAKG
jgi:mersacidin/lichenicidin family type 2 lantibiotic